MNNRTVYVKTDKNGTKIYHDYTCQRCGGLGASEAWKFTGMTCYECGGSGVSKARIIREYTPEYAAKLEEKRQARYEKRIAEARAKADSLNEQFLAEYFPEGKLYCLSLTDKDAWEVMSQLQEAGVQYINSVGYAFTKRPEGFATVEVTPGEITYLDKTTGIRYFSISAWDTIQKKIKASQPVSQYVGTVGEKLTVKAIYKYRASFESQFGTTYIHKFVTVDGNDLVWKTGVGYFGASEDDMVEITATIKEHSEYKGKKQTALLRCKITVQG